MEGAISSFDSPNVDFSTNKLTPNRGLGQARILVTRFKCQWVNSAVGQQLGTPQPRGRASRPRQQERSRPGNELGATQAVGSRGLSSPGLSLLTSMTRDFDSCNTQEHDYRQERYDMQESKADQSSRPQKGPSIRDSLPTMRNRRSGCDPVQNMSTLTTRVDRECLP